MRVSHARRIALRTAYQGLLISYGLYPAVIKLATARTAHAETPTGRKERIVDLDRAEEVGRLATH